MGVPLPCQLEPHNAGFDHQGGYPSTGSDPRRLRPPALRSGHRAQYKTRWNRLHANILATEIQNEGQLLVLESQEIRAGAPLEFDREDSC